MVRVRERPAAVETGLVFGCQNFLSSEIRGREIHRNSCWGNCKDKPCPGVPEFPDSNGRGLGVHLRQHMRAGACVFRTFCFRSSGILEPEAKAYPCVCPRSCFHVLRALRPWSSGAVDPKGKAFPLTIGLLQLEPASQPQDPVSGRLPN
jgi:hypothetical protein